MNVAIHLSRVLPARSSWSMCQRDSVPLLPVITRACDAPALPNLLSTAGADHQDALVPAGWWSTLYDVQANQRSAGTNGRSLSSSEWFFLGTVSRTLELTNGAGSTFAKSAMQSCRRFATQAAKCSIPAAKFSTRCFLDLNSWSLVGGCGSGCRSAAAAERRNCAADEDKHGREGPAASIRRSGNDDRAEWRGMEELWTRCALQELTFGLHA